MLVMLVLNFGVVIGDDHAPATAVGEADVAELQGIIDKLPFDEGGETNFSKYKPFITNATRRIDAINEYLDENAGWMRFLFHMRPQISMLFVLNLYFILLFFMVLVLNAKGIWFFIEDATKARIFGGALFVAFAAIGLYVGIAHVLNNWLLYIWRVLVDSSIWIALIVLVVLIVLIFFFGFGVIGAIVKGIGRYSDYKKKVRDMMEAEANTKSMKKMLGQIKKK